ncbi:MAG: MgtC/SapB family protein [Desulfuromonadales bacterium]|nr:MgtC/SapB family protein [Desulfuromonadales bacterium]
MSFNIDLAIVYKLLFATLFGALIGLEREIHGRPAGFRTHLLVSLGACLYVIVSIAFYQIFGNIRQGGPLGADPARVAAQVVVGIGFIGAGAVIREKASVRGLTTAACLWVAAAIGMACGLGLFSISMAVTVIALISLLVLKNVESFIKKDTYVKLIILCKDSDGLFDEINKIISDCSIDIMNVGINKNIENSEILLTYSIKSKAKELPCDFINLFSKLRGVKKISQEENVVSR